MTALAEVGSLVVERCSFETCILPSLALVTRALRVLGDENDIPANTISVIEFPQLVTIGTDLFIDHQSSLDQCNFPVLTSLAASPSPGPGTNAITNNPELVSLLMPLVTPPQGSSAQFPLTIRDNRLNDCEIADNCKCEINGCVQSNSCGSLCVQDNCPFASFAGDICIAELCNGGGSVQLGPTTFERCAAIAGNLVLDRGDAEDKVDWNVEDHLPDLLIILGNLNVLRNTNLSSFTMGQLQPDKRNGITVSGDVDILSNSGMTSLNLDKIRTVDGSVYLNDNTVGEVTTEEGISFSWSGLNVANEIHVRRSSFQTIVLPSLQQVDSVFIVGSINVDMNTIASVSMPVIETFSNTFQIIGETSLVNIAMPELMTMSAQAGSEISGNTNLQTIVMPKLEPIPGSPRFPFAFSGNNDENQQGSGPVVCDISGCALNNVCGTTCEATCPFTNISSVAPQLCNDLFRLDGKHIAK